MNAQANKTYYLQLNISADEYLKVYRGVASQVSAQSIDGVNLRFPANALKPYLTRAGIQGNFVMRVDVDNRLVDIHRIA